MNCFVGRLTTSRGTLIAQQLLFSSQLSRRVLARVLSTADEGGGYVDSPGNTEGQQPRNPVLAEAMRETFSLLQEPAKIIQRSRHSQQELFPTAYAKAQYNDELDVDADMPPPNVNEPEFTSCPRYQYTLFHLHETATHCIETIAERNPARRAVAEWVIDREPVELVHVRLSSTLQNATLYWTLPSRFFEGPRPPLTHDVEAPIPPIIQRRLEHIMEMQHILDGKWNSKRDTISPADRLARSIQHHLRTHLQWTRVPALRIEPASPNMVYRILIGENPVG